jgi:antirestriction protein ArdC
VAILTALPGSRAGDALATALAITAETARIFDSQAPTLHDGLDQSPVTPETAPTQEHPPQSSRPSQGRDFRQEITDKMVAALEQGDIPWKRPWRSTDRPMNGLSGHRYQGINRFMTMLTQFECGYGDPRWLTFNQVRQAGGHVKKGEHGVQIEMWKPRPFWARKDVTVTLDRAAVRVFGESSGGRVEIGNKSALRPTSAAHESTLRVEHGGKVVSWRDAHETLDTFSSRIYTVFNIEQCGGLDPGKLVPLAECGEQIDAHTRGEFLMASMRADGVEFKEGADGACYVPPADGIRLPSRDRFVSQEAYYATSLHEIGHSTGAAHRLNRDGIVGAHAFGSDGYAREELRAELASAFLAAETGIAPVAASGDAPSAEVDFENQHKAYLQHWAKALKSDKNEIFRAAKEAGEAADYVLAREHDLAQALETATVTLRQAQVLESVCAEQGLTFFAGRIDAAAGELLRVECGANGDLSLRDPGTGEHLGNVPTREADLARALKARRTLAIGQADGAAPHRARPVRPLESGIER